MSVDGCELVSVLSECGWVWNGECEWASVNVLMSGCGWVMWMWMNVNWCPWMSVNECGLVSVTGEYECVNRYEWVDWWEWVNGLASVNVNKCDCEWVCGLEWCEMVSVSELVSEDCWGWMSVWIGECECEWVWMGECGVKEYEWVWELVWKDNVNGWVEISELVSVK